MPAAVQKDTSLLATVDWSEIREQYDRRVDLHDDLLRLHQAGPSRDFSELALGASMAAGNYSASEHALGPRVLACNPNVDARIHQLADLFLQVPHAKSVPQLIRCARIRYLQIGVGSELSCMMNPGVCWVANVRTLWAHLLIQHGDDLHSANEALRLYRSGDPDSEMAYRIWAELHRLLEVSLTRLAKMGSNESRGQGVAPGELGFIWADAIASRQYAEHHG